MRPLLTAVVVGLALLGPAPSSPPAPAVRRLVGELRRLYSSEVQPAERWSRRAPSVTLADGREVARDSALREQPEFTEAAALLLASPEADDAPLGAWLLTTLPVAGRDRAEPLLVGALRHPDPRAAFEAARGLGAVGGEASLGALERTARKAPSPEVRTAATWAGARVRERTRLPAPRPEGGARLPSDFLRGVSWWMSESGDDAGAASFRALRDLGVRWVSIHTWDPRQRRLDDPVLAPPRHRFGLNHLPALVESAHAAGLRVLLKPHLEMRSHDPVLRGRHNEIEMRSEADWVAWFRGYEDYLLDYARQARAARVDMLCVGRELDRTAILREPDWRRLIGRVRGTYPGPLVYSANFDTYRGIAFWDALDFVGVSAYFPVGGPGTPEPDDLARGWARVLPPLEELSRRVGRPVLLTELGYPAVAGAAEKPWLERKGPADVWLQARLYGAALRAISEAGFVGGAFFWLWEGTTQPPFRDPSFSIQGKPAAFVMTRWYGG